MFRSQKTKNNLKNNHGFTLVELLIYIAIVAVVVSSLIYFGVSIFSYRNKNFAAQEVQANIRMALREISRLARSASSTNPIIDSGQLSLKMGDLTKDPTVISATTDQILQVKEGLQTAKTITSKNVKVTKLKFTNLSGNSDIDNIKIEMTIAYYNPSDDINYDYSEDVETAVSLRR
jgi:prepilin-type N-terminal cleavage/methylation domain-containing protein